MSYQDEESKLQDLLRRGIIDDDVYSKRHQLLVLKTNPEYVDNSNRSLWTKMTHLFYLRGRLSLSAWLSALFLFLFFEASLIGFGILLNLEWFEQTIPPLLNAPSYTLESIKDILYEIMNHATLPNHISDILHVALFLWFFGHCVRRLHDSGHSGYMIVRTVVLAWVCWIGMFVIDACIKAIPDMASVFFRILTYGKWGLNLVMVYLLLVPVGWLFCKGTSGSNQYGPPST